MNEKILEEFDREFVKDCGPDVEPIFICAVGSVGPIRQFLSAKLDQARAEERERVVGEIRAKTKGVRDSLLIYFHNAVSDQKAPYRHAIQAIEEELLYSTRADYFKKKI